MVIIDSSAWSIAFRRTKTLTDPGEMAIAKVAYELVDRDSACMMGLIRQEVLSGISTQKLFNELCDYLSIVEDSAVLPKDYIVAAQFYNLCRSKGIQGSHIDLLLCAVASRLDYPVLASDKDFLHYARVLPIRLHPVMQAFSPV
jgi:predicted nucleic acid-binding protein